MNPMSYLEQAKPLDWLTAPVQRAVRLLPPGRVRDALHGVWLGHPLHPVLVQLPVGTWLSASLPPGALALLQVSGVGGLPRRSRC
jgi:hypothetical protein